jgi:hypothetical protein
MFHFQCFIPAAGEPVLHTRLIVNMQESIRDARSVVVDFFKLVIRARLLVFNSDFLEFPSVSDAKDDEVRAVVSDRRTHLHILLCYKDARDAVMTSLRCYSLDNAHFLRVRNAFCYKVVENPQDPRFRFHLHRRQFATILEKTLGLCSIPPAALNAAA